MVGSGGMARGSGPGCGLAKKPPPAEASAASAAISRGSTNVNTSLKSTAPRYRPLVDVAGCTSQPLPLTGHCRPCKVLLDRHHFFSLPRAWLAHPMGPCPLIVGSMNTMDGLCCSPSLGGSFSVVCIFC
jgi:hypothetical protein